MDIHQARTAIVTGGASGLGKALCLQLAERGVAVGVADIDSAGAAETLAAMAPPRGGLQHFATACDTRRDSSFVQLQSEVSERWQGRLDLLINNAGIAATGDLLQTDMTDWEAMLNTNLLGVVRGCRQFVPLLQEAPAAWVVNIASFAGLANAPGMITYNVAKAGVIALSESLRSELHPLGIGVSVACPAFFPTRLMDKANAPAEVRAQVQRLMHKSGVTAEDVARDILAGVQDERFMVITHKDARRAYLLKRWMPERFFRTMLKQSAKFRRTDR